MRFLILFSLAAMSALPQSDMAVRSAVNRALPPIQKSAAAFVAKRACFSCHHNALTILVLHEARNRGFAIDSTVLDAVEAKTFRSLTAPTAFDDIVQAVDLNDPTPNDSFLLWAASVAGIHRTPTTAVLAHRLAQWQLSDGHWITSDFRPPHSSSYFTATASAIQAMRWYAVAQDKARLAAARSWLAHARPHSTEDASFRLLGLVWASAPAAELAQAKRDLFAMRDRSGGWPELPGYPTDAYSTGEAIYALRNAGAPSSDPAIDAGLRFLTSSQAPDGTWRVHTRMLSPAEVSPEYFTTGFPYQKDEYLSFAGSVWATMALLSVFPDLSPALNRMALASGPHSPLDAALRDSYEFGIEMERLDANTKTERGTTLLMAAAGDSSKVQLLLNLGANPKARAASNIDVLTVAASVRNNSRSVQLLLDAGADPNSPPGIRAKNSPLLLASMTGDTASIRLLLSHGAKASAAALSQAVTFGYPEVVRLLIEAGADPKITESSGINLLHWATIADRASVIPILAAAGVSINAQDEHGFTPLMYAATIDFGDTAALEALLKAGADPGIRNEDGRDAIEQAHHYGHVNLEAALRKSKR